MQGNIEREAIDLQGQAPTRAKERAQAASKSLASSSTSPSPMGLTTEELMLIAKRREKQEAAGTKKAGHASLTGDLAPFPSLGTRWSQDLPLNIAGSVKHRMMVRKWKELLWMTRIKQAVTLELPKARWKRNPRWLAMMLTSALGASRGIASAAASSGRRGAEAVKQELLPPLIWRPLRRGGHSRSTAVGDGRKRVTSFCSVFLAFTIIVG